jgi:hypothetical protein
MVGASAVAAAAARIAVRDDLTIAASSCGTVASLRGSAGVGTSTVGLSRQLGSSTVTAEVRAATCSFVVAVPRRGRLGDPIVDSHEVSVFYELGDDFSSTYPLSLACDRCDRHEALLWGGVYPALDGFESFREVADGEIVLEAPASFVPLSVSLTSSVPVGVGLIRGCFSRQLVCGDVFKVLVLCRPRRSWRVAGSHEDLAIGVAKTGVRARHLGWSVLLSSSEWCSLLEWKRVEVGDVA